LVKRVIIVIEPGVVQGFRGTTFGRAGEEQAFGKGTL
jgi:hypothetical protein